MRICFLLIFLFSTKIILAQTIDSLVSLNQLDVEQSEKTVEKINDFINQGNNLQSKKKYKAAALSFEEAIQLLEHQSEKNDTLLAKCYKNAAINYSYLELYDLVKKSSLKSIQYTRRTEANEVLVWNYTLLGETYFIQGQYENALSYFDSCLQIDTELKDTIGITSDLISIGRINTKIGREQKGLQHLKEALTLSKLNQHKYTECLALNALGLGYSNCKNFENAERFILESLEVAKEMKDSNLIVNRFINLGDIHTKSGNIDKAETYLLKSLSFTTNAFQAQRNVIIYRNLGEVYRQKKEFQKAISFNKKALKIAEEKNMLPNIRIIYQHLQKIYKAQGNYSKALSFAEKAEVISDSIFTIKARKRADIFNNKFTLFEKEKAIQNLRFTNQLKEKDLEQLQTHRKWLFISLLLGLILSAVSFYAFRERQQRLIAAKESKIANQLNEIAKLRKDIEAVLEEKEQHFLASSLSCEEINQLISEPISEREFEVLQLLIKGHNNKEIASELFLSVNTIKFHLKNIYAKLDVKNRLEVIQLALKK